MAGIVVEALAKSYRGVRVLDGISFQAQSGSVTGLLGPNGSGKTTVLRLMTGLARGHGRVRYNGVAFDEHLRPRDHIGVLTGSAAFNLARTGLGHLQLVAAGAGLDPSRARTILREVGLEDVAGQRIKTYSLGMRQRLALATAMIGDPQFLVLDEPTNALDPAAVVWFGDWMRRLADQGRCVLISTHQVHEAERFLDHAVILVAGRVRAHGSIAELRAAAAADPVVVAETGAVTQLCAALLDRGLRPYRQGHERVLIPGGDPATVGQIAAHAGISLQGLWAQHGSLEEVLARLCAPAHGCDQ